MSAQDTTVLFHPVTLGVCFGLAIGKPIGITLFTWLATRILKVDLIQGATWPMIAGVGCLGGIGFTMSIFIAELSFSSNYEMLVTAKTAIIIASVLSGVLGYLWLRLISAR